MITNATNGLVSSSAAHPRHAITDATCIFNEALQLPSEASAYYLSQALAATFPDSTVIEVADHRFDLDEYARAGMCTVNVRNVPHGRWVTRSVLPGETTSASTRQAWFDVGWRDCLFQVIVLTIDDFGDPTHAFIVAPVRDQAERFVASVCTWHEELRREVLVYDGGRWRKDDVLYRAIGGATFETLVLPDRMAQSLHDDVMGFFALRETYERYNAPWKRGILLVGPPGNGKTHAIKAAVNRSGRRCLYVQSFRGGCTPDEDSIHEVFNRARYSAPCILVIEDLDALVTNQNRSVLLNELDGFAENAGILTLATTNHADRLDPAIVDRPSRFDRKYHFELPGASERAEYVGRWNRSLEREAQCSDETLLEVVDLTAGFSFAYLKELFMSSLLQWVSNQRRDNMDLLITEQARMLRGQMAAPPEGMRGQSTP